MHCFDIKPFEGALPLTFGMPIAAVHEQVGLHPHLFRKSGTNRATPTTGSNLP